MWSLLAIYLTDVLLGKGKKLTQTRTNLIQVQVQDDYYKCGISQLKCKHITIYDPTELIRIKHVTNHDIRYKQLPFGRVRSKCKLKLNRRKRGLRGGQSKKAYQKITKPRGVALKNLSILPCIPKKGIKHKVKLWLILLNTQSIKNKEDLLTDSLQCDIAVITETWLNDSAMDAIWMESNGFKKDGYQISAINKIGKKEGGLALIYGKNVTVKKVDQKQHKSFKSVHWWTTIGNKTLNILGLYHSPYSATQKITNSMFIDDLTDYLTDWMASHRNIIICGDFNIHIHDLTGIEA